MSTVSDVTVMDGLIKRTMNDKQYCNNFGLSSLTDTTWLYVLEKR